MPPVVVAVAAGVAAGAAAASVIVGVAVAIGTIALTEAMKPEMPSLEQDTEQAQSMITSGVAPRRGVYGEMVVSGVIVGYGKSKRGEGDSTKDHHVVAIAIADHETEDLQLHQINGESIGGLGANATYYKGNQTTADTLLKQVVDGWTPNHVGKGVTYAVVEVPIDSEKLPQGLRNVTFKVKGKKVYDPRKDPTFGGTGTHNADDPTTWEWSNNPILCAFDYMRFHGYKQQPLSRFDIANIIQEANICDEQVTYDDEGTQKQQKRFTCNGFWSFSEAPADVLQNILSSCAGKPYRRGGRIYLRTGTYAGIPTLTIGSDDLAGAVRYRPNTPEREKCNTVRATFNDAKNDYAPSEAPIYKQDAAIQSDGTAREQELKLRFTTDAATCQRLQKIHLERNRAGFLVDLEVNAKGLLAMAGSTVYLDIKEDGIQGDFLVADWTYNQAKKTVSLVLLDERPEIYSDELHTSAAKPVFTVPDNTQVSPPTALTFTATPADNNYNGKLTWQHDEPTLVKSYLVRISNDPDAQTQGDETLLIEDRVSGRKLLEYHIENLPQGSYQIEVSAVSNHDRESLPVTIFATVEPPAAPTAINLKVGNFFIEVTPSAPQASHHTLYEVKAGSSNNESLATPIGIGRTVVESDLLPNTTRFYWARSITPYGTSAWFGFAQATTTKAADPIKLVLANALTESELATTLKSRINKIDTQLTTAGDGGLIQALTDAEGRITTAEQDIQSQGTLINSTKQTSDLNAEKLDVLGVYDAQAGTLSKVVELEQADSNAASRISVVETEQGSQSTRITNVESTQSSHGTRLTDLETDSANTQSRVTTLETTSSDQAQRIEQVSVAARALDDSNNLLKASEWTAGAGSHSGTNYWGRNGTSTENIREAGRTPYGNGIVWRSPSDGDNSASGGWSVNFTLDPSKKHRFICWYKRDELSITTDGYTYLGCSQSNTENLDGTANGNPYFKSLKAKDLGIKASEWFCIVGILHEAGYTGAPHPDAGIYNSKGEKVGTATDYRIKAGVTRQTHRAYQYYETTAGATQWFAEPRVEALDGTEIPLSQLLDIDQGRIAAAEDAARAYTDNETGEIKAERTIKVDANGKVAGIGLIAGTNSDSELFFTADKIAIVPPNWSGNQTDSIAPFVYDSALGKVILNKAHIVDLTAERIKGGNLTIDGFSLTSTALNMPAGTIKEHMIDNQFTSSLLRIDPNATTQGGSFSTNGSDVSVAKTVALATFESGGSTQTINFSVRGAKSYDDAHYENFKLEILRNGSPIAIDGANTYKIVETSVSIENEERNMVIKDTWLRYDLEVVFTNPTQGTNYTYSVRISNPSGTVVLPDATFSFSVSEPTKVDGGAIAITDQVEPQQDTGWNYDYSGLWVQSTSSPANSGISGYVDSIHFGHSGGAKYHRALNVRHSDHTKLYYSWNSGTGTWSHYELYHSGNKPSWVDVEGKPSTYTPSAHSHNSADYVDSKINLVHPTSTQEAQVNFTSGGVDYRIFGRGADNQFGFYLVGSGGQATRLRWVGAGDYWNVEQADFRVNGSSVYHAGNLPTQVRATDDRDVKPSATGVAANNKGMAAFFTSLEGLTGAAGSNWQDLLVLDTYSDSSGGKPNALAFDKSEQVIRHYQPTFNSSTTWGSYKTLAYVEDTYDDSGSYRQLLSKGGATDSYVRTPLNGIIPSSSTGSPSCVGTSGWRFSQGHFVTLYENGSKLADKYAGFGSNTYNGTQIVNGIDAGNPAASYETARLSGYGLLGNRPTFYLTNNGVIQIGNGSTHNASPSLTIGASTVISHRNLEVEGDLKVEKSSGTLLSSSTFHDVLGYNPSYGTYIRSSAGTIYTSADGVAPIFNSSSHAFKRIYHEGYKPTWNDVTGKPTLNELNSVSGACSSTGWYTIAYGSARRNNKFVISDGDSGRHNSMTIEVSAAFGKGSISVLHSIAYGSITMPHVRLLYTTADRTYGNVKLQVYASAPPFTMAVVRHGMGNLNSGWSDWTIQTPTLENSPSGYTELCRSEYIMSSSGRAIFPYIKSMGDIYAVGTIEGADTIARSDRRVKRNIKTIDKALGRLRQLAGYTYERTDLENKKSAGVIAQEVEKVLPEAVNKTEGLLHISQSALIGLLVQAIKELDAKVEKLKRGN